MPNRINPTVQKPHQGGIVTNVAAEDWKVEILDTDRADDTIEIHGMPADTLYWPQSLVVPEAAIAGVTINVGVRQVRSYGTEPLFEDLTYFAAGLALTDPAGVPLFEGAPKQVRVPDDHPDAVSVRGHLVDHMIVVTLKGAVADATGKFSFVPMFWVKAAYD